MQKTRDTDIKDIMSQAKFYEGYSRWSDEHGRYETWEEAVSRVMNMHREYYKDKIEHSPELAQLINEAESLYKLKYVLGAQRALQWGGDQLLKHQMRMYNCFSQDTTFVTSAGMRSFADFSDGDTATVLTHTGEWKPAKVKSYGKQMLNSVIFTKGNNEVTVNVTSDHRWILHDGSETTSLKVGDRILKEPSIFGDFDWESASPDEQLYWLYGFVYGDGTINGNHSMIRLCGHDVQYKERFERFGFKTSSSHSLSGDFMAYTGKYKKTLPDPEVDSPEMIRAFVAGYLCADGCKNANDGGKQYCSIQATGEESINFIRECFPIAGVHIISETDYTGQKTNYGVRPYTIRFTICDHAGSKYNSGWKVRSIEESHEDVVWCLEVEDNHSFVLKSGIVTGNCTSAYADRPEFFGEAFYILLCGAGAGFSVQKHHVAKLPKIAERKKQAKVYEVEDSIEGWADALSVLMSSYFVGGGTHPEFEGRKVYFDLSGIRPKGAEISGGFKAPGPEPLRRSLDKIEYLLQGLVLKGQDALQPIHAYDIVMHSSDAVLAGGVRRSATICLFSHDDEEMMNAKTGNWFVDNPQRARSNNSAVILRDEVTREEFSKFISSIRQYGEPGFYFVNSKEHTTNPCVEIGMFPQINGKSGWQGCNLTEINGSMCTNEDEFFKACRAASILGTLQAGYTDFRYVSDTTKKIFEREALLGVSITGWMNNPDVLFDEETQKEGAKLVKKMNTKVAKLIEINPAARTTCVKPSGNASVLLKTASGIHAEHSPRYLRHVQMNKESEVGQLIAQTNPYMVEESVWSSNQTDFSIAFPIISKEGSIFRKESLGIDFLEKVKKVQANWVEYGTNVKQCADPTVRHNVSNTCTVPDDQWEAVEEYVFENRKFFSGISFLSDSGDKAYNQAPNAEVLTENQIIEKYGRASLFASGLIVDSHKGFANLWGAVDVAKYRPDQSGELSDLRAEWIRRFNKFANNYFEGDMTLAENCLKDVYYLHKWTKIQQNLKPIDFTNQLVMKKFTDIDTTGAAACVGGGCEIQF